MLNDILALLKQELVVSFIILILLMIKVGATEWKNENILNLVNLLLLINFIAEIDPYRLDLIQSQALCIIGYVLQD